MVAPLIIRNSTFLDRLVSFFSTEHKTLGLRKLTRRSCHSKNAIPGDY